MTQINIGDWVCGRALHTHCLGELNNNYWESNYVWRYPKLVVDIKEYEDEMWAQIEFDAAYPELRSWHRVTDLAVDPMNSFVQPNVI